MCQDSGGLGVQTASEEVGDSCQYLQEQEKTAYISLRGLQPLTSGLYTQAHMSVHTLLMHTQNQTYHAHIKEQAISTLHKPSLNKQVLAVPSHLCRAYLEGNPA